MSAAAIETGTIRTRIPARLDRLPWSRFHWLILLGLGTAWILDGLEVTIVGSVASRMTESGSGIDISTAQIGTAASIYVIGACAGALFFGQLTDRFGRRNLFMITLAVYLVATAVTAASFSPWFFFVMRFFTGAGIGGEYAAINSAIDELIPARARGRIDLVINGSYWIGSAGGSAAAIFFLDTSIFPKDLGWRLAFLLGVVLAIAVMFVRRHVPESPRWLFIHGREDEAERLVDEIERGVQEQTGEQLGPVDRQLTVRQRKAIPFREIARVAVKVYPRRSLLCLALFVGQAFIYNGVTFNLGTLMTTFFNVSSGFVPVFIIVYALSNFVGPLVLGRLFDTVGRKPMISTTYLGSAAIALVLAALFAKTDLLTAWPFIIVVMGSFFLASAGASAAYLTASEIFPMETRALAIAFFYAIGTAVGGISGPLLFGKLIGSNDRGLVALAFAIGAAVMAVGGITEIFLGVAAEGRQLEDIAKPLTVADAESGAGGDGTAGGSGGSQPDGAQQPDEPQRTVEERAHAAEERAHAAERRAAAHEALARAGSHDPEAAERAEVEFRLAESADVLARAHDEYAAAGDERGSDGVPLGSAAEYRARAAEQRAHAFEHEAAALVAEDEEQAGRRHRLQAAAQDRARSFEQLAFAVDARQEADNDGSGSAVVRERAGMHVLWARMHEHLADAQQLEANGDDAGAQREREQAHGCEERARAAAFRAEAAEHRAEAAEDQASSAAGADAGERAAGAVRAGVDHASQRSAAEERIRERIRRRQQRERQGIRRYRPGPGRSGWSPAVTSAAPPPEEALDNEIESIRRALDEHGPTERRELAAMVGARYWGPGVFRAALRIAVSDGAVVRTGRSAYALPDAGEDE